MIEYSLDDTKCPVGLIATPERISEITGLPLDVIEDYAKTGKLVKNRFRIRKSSI